VVLDDYRFNPDQLRFVHGQRYRLILENRGRELHDFTAPEFFRAIRLEGTDVAAGGELVLRPGERKELRFLAEQIGRFRLICADHDWAGMVGAIIIG
jgi:uncharacterized cupredoxin-like copper-binding protein